MKTEFTHVGDLLLGGVSFYGDPFSVKEGWDADNEIGKTWQRFSAFTHAYPQRPYSCGGAYLYEVHLYGPETKTKGYFEVFVGEAVTTAQLPFSLNAKYIPASDYLKVTLYGAEITGDWWNETDDAVLAASGLVQKSAYLILAYDERFKGMDKVGESALDVFIPVEKKQA